MSDVVSLELLLDRATEDAVRAEWAALADAGMSSLAPHTSPSNRPHVTLLVRPTLAPLDAGLLARIAATLPLAVTLGEPILFGDGDRRVFVRPVALTPELEELHRMLHAGVAVGEGPDRREVAGARGSQDVPLRASDRTGAFEGDDSPMDEDAPHTRPGEWTPHVTLARRLRVSDIPAARALVSGELHGRVTALRRWDAASKTVTELVG
ncbi:2'-5' RNA ligase family protein [Okibacterium fritillariae]|uniref:2'-5' RNA ligase superfamily protein n=1 Tax=Okibacterium fritillariae TaxID=123320 RepID=A0A1T5IAV5_9MICO|nr:2'-5' RNA ligase family protein [Okibacterium fritillariae]SKC36309.1 2'-5' RNA ligase superfamily protein [Okibacterium fritillariae]